MVEGMRGASRQCRKLGFIIATEVSMVFASTGWNSCSEYIFIYAVIVIKVTRDRQEELRVETENQKIKDKRQLPYLENPPMLHVIKNSPFIEPNS